MVPDKQFVSKVVKYLLLSKLIIDYPIRKYVIRILFMAMQLQWPKYISYDLIKLNFSNNHHIGKILIFL